MERVIQLRATEPGERVDKYVAQVVPDLSRSLIQRLIREGRVTVDGRAIKASYRVETGDEIVVQVPPPEAMELEPEAIPLDVVYEDEDLIVVNKPSGLVVHPSHGHRRGTLVNAILAHCPDLGGINGTLRPGIVHRLDKDTSGLIIVAKNDAAQQSLQQQFKGRHVKKVYLALVEGRLEPKRGLIEAPIGRHPRQRKRMAVTARGGREARTEYRVLEYLGEYTLVEAHPLTGRTHQVRVHFASLGHPLVGDPVYGFRRQRLGLGRQFLHAWKLGFRLPSSGQPIELTAELPQDLHQVLQELGSGFGRNP
ncbi:MAG: RluA family pseudouridine synthase [Anaerolineae bacterium]